MKKVFKSDSFIMFISVFISILLWIYVVYEQNPMHEKWITDVPVKYTNQTADFENGKLIVLEGATEMVDVKIRGRRSSVSGVDASAVTCSVNMGEITEAGSYTLPVTFNTSTYGIELMQKKPNSVSMVVDKVVTDERQITVTQSGQVANGYIAGEIECQPMVVKLTGPQTIVRGVDKAVVNVDMTNVSQDIANLCKIKLYDSAGNEVVNELISKNIEYCDIKCPVYTAKTVAVTPILRSETNKDGHPVTVSSVSPAELALVGNADLLAGIETIYTYDIDTYNVTESTKVTAKLNLGDVPEGVTVQDDIIEAEIELYPEVPQQPDNGEQQDSEENNNGGNE